MMNNQNRDLDNIVDKLRQGKIGVFPCDTIWGIVAVARQETVERIYQIKKRKKDQPMIIMVPNISMAKEYAMLTKKEEILVKKYWPGPVSFVFRKKNEKLDFLVGKKATIAIRIPLYKPLNYLLEHLKEPIVSTSANISNEQSSLCFADISIDVLNQVDFVFKTLRPLVGVESAIVDCVSEKLRILRGNIDLTILQEY
jgi:L-threonylcarbamoyladenylate synthase